MSLPIPHTLEKIRPVQKYSSFVDLNILSLGHSKNLPQYKLFDVDCNEEKYLMLKSSLQKKLEEIDKRIQVSLENLDFFYKIHNFTFGEQTSDAFIGPEADEVRDQIEFYLMETERRKISALSLLETIIPGFKWSNKSPQKLMGYDLKKDMKKKKSCDKKQLFFQRKVVVMCLEQLKILKKKLDEENLDLDLFG